MNHQKEKTKQHRKKSSGKDSFPDPMVTRRQFLLTAGGTGLTLGVRGFPAVVRAGLKSKTDRMIVIGIDGMDPTLLARFMQNGQMPNCRRLIQKGSFRHMFTSNPPQSPVAWSNFITGTNPGGHGIFDFITRDAATRMPGFSMSRTEPARRFLEIGGWKLPLEKGRAVNLRKGPTFWNHLARNGVQSTVFRVPVNFPPTESEARTLAGLGTPDIHGSYGIFTFYTDDPSEETRNVSGGRIASVRVRDNIIRCVLHGPENSFAADNRKVEIPMTVTRDPERRVAKITVQENELILKQGEWSDWVAVKFPMVPYLAEASAICRFFLKTVRNPFELYLSPVNIDPENPALPISTPPGYARELVRDVGHFYTQGMPEDTAALSAGVLNDDEYREQAAFVLNERIRLFHHELGRFRKGFFFFYFSSLDLNSHAFWRTMDTGHPLYTPELAEKQGDFLPWLYSQMDGVIGSAMKQTDDRTILAVISDHGFTSFRRQFNLNSWLMDNGYAEPFDPLSRGETGFFENVRWDATRAYGIGINSLYINQADRENGGIVKPGEASESLSDELIKRLTSVRDPQTGERVISNVYRPRDIYTGPYVNQAPDLIVGYNRHYRASWDTVLGSYPVNHLEDNTDPWSGDHTMDPSLLPGVFLCNRPVDQTRVFLEDMAPTILAEFGLPPPPEMTGKKITWRI